MTAGTFLILSARLGDAFGYKLILMIGFSWFTLWSVVAGLAVYSGYLLFVFIRVFQGVGAAICIPNALAILGAAYPPGQRKAMVFSISGVPCVHGEGPLATIVDLPVKLGLIQAFYTHKLNNIIIIAITFTILFPSPCILWTRQHQKLDASQL